MLKNFGSILLLCLFVTSAQAETEIDFIKKAYHTLSQTHHTGTQLDLTTMQHIRQLFDFEQFCKKTTIDISSKMSAEEMAEFKNLFARAFFKKIAHKGIRLSDKKLENIQYKLENRSQKMSLATVSGVSEKTEVVFKFELRPQQGSWLITDLSVNGALLSRNYRGQFNRLYRTEGYVGLQRRMQGKVSKAPSAVSDRHL